MLPRRCLNRVVFCAACGQIFALLANGFPLLAGEKKMPPVGIEVPAAKRAVLETKLEALAAEIAALEQSSDKSFGSWCRMFSHLLRKQRTRALLGSGVLQAGERLMRR